MVFSFSKKGKEITKIYNGLIPIVSGVNVNPFIGYIDIFNIVPFSKHINVEYVSENRYHEESLYGIIIKIVNMAEKQIDIEMSLTPLQITLELWDKGQKEKIEKLVSQINKSEHPFDMEKGRDYENLTTSDIWCRVDKEYGLQFYTNLSYEVFDEELIEKNLLYLMAYSTKCTSLIEDEYIFNRKISV